ncbi:MAG TPA: helix-turn-helix domain-containing protein [Bryobacteraceae bacterium]|nr:helix-turn-helix domain-containing protein [Bryobacteraceae bacterium]
MSTNLPQLLTETDVSKQLSVSLAALRRWRPERRGPHYIKVGALVRYRPEDVEEWLAAQPSGGAPVSTKAAQTSLAVPRRAGVFG